MKSIAIIDTGYKDYTYEENLFGGEGFALKLYSGDSSVNIDKAHFASGSIGILVRGTVINSTFLDHTPELRAIVRYGVGYDNIDLAEATRRGIRVANVQGYANHSVSDHAIAMIYACIRSLPYGSAGIREIFSRPPAEDIFELHDKTAGIIGLGRIGTCFASKIRHLFRNVLAYDPYIDDHKFVEAGVEKTDLTTILEKSHVISIHCNLTDETRHIIDNKAFSLMKKQPVLINTSRGPVVCQDALIDALNRKLIHSAGIDVFEDEPPGQRQEPLFNHQRAIVTGHYAWYSDNSMVTLQKRAADNLINLLTGKKIDDQLNMLNK
jgi:D-3-phosphoglycerate dehydrogenase